MKDFSILPEASQAAIPPEQLARLDQALSSLEKALLEQDPLLPNHLAASHKVLISYPETVHLLEDEEIARLIKAAEIHTNTKIVAEAAKGKGGSKKKISADEL
jgi:hypothetical protein